MPYRVSLDAEADLDEIYVYGADTFGVRQANQYAESVLSLFDLLGGQPRLGIPLKDNWRAAFHQSHVIVYWIGDDDAIEIGRVLSVRSNWRRKIEDL